MQDLKLIAINEGQGIQSKTVFNCRINPVNNTNPIELVLYIQEYSTYVAENILNHYQEKRQMRNEHRNEIAKLIAEHNEEVARLTEIIHKKETK